MIDCVLVVSAPTGSVDAIRDYADRLREGLRDVGKDARVVGIGDPLPQQVGCVILQYNPFSFGRRGFAPSLLVWAARQRARRGPKGFDLMVHEPYVAVTSARTAVMSAWQRLQFAVLRGLARRVVAPSADQARRCRTRRRVAVIPVGSNLPDRRAARQDGRRRIAASPGDIVLVSFAASPAGRLQEYVRAAVAKLVATGKRPVLLVLGAANAAPDDLPAAARVVVTGHLPDADLATLLSAGDIFLAPFVDGVSTRRTALMAAMQHQLAVIGTCTAQTDALLRDRAPLVLVRAGDSEAFAREVDELASNAERRASLGRSARDFYAREFAWPQIASQVAAELM